MTPATLYLCGLGQFPEHTATLEVLHALGRCRVAAYAGGAAVRRELARYCPGVALFPCETPAGWARLARELRRGGAVGFAGPGQPLLANAWGARALREAARAGAQARALAGISGVGVALARLGITLGIDLSGMQAYAASALPSARGLDPEQPVVVLFDGGSTARAGAALSRLYGERHPCLLLGAVNEPSRPVAAGEVGKLRARQGGVLWAPPRVARWREA